LKFSFLNEKALFIMDKAKIVLSALGVLAVIGTALAFKANKTYGGNLRCSTFTTVNCTGTLPANQCTAVTYSTTNSPIGSIRYCTVVNNPTAPCVCTRVVVNL
jgi:hypothetical protein